MPKALALLAALLTLCACETEPLPDGYYCDYEHFFTLLGAYNDGEAHLDAMHPFDYAAACENAPEIVNDLFLATFPGGVEDSLYVKYRVPMSREQLARSGRRLSGAPVID